MIAHDSTRYSGKGDINAWPPFNCPFQPYCNNCVIIHNDPSHWRSMVSAVSIK